MLLVGRAIAVRRQVSVVTPSVFQRLTYIFHSTAAQETSSRQTSSDKLTALRSDPDANTGSANATPRPSTPNRPSHFGITSAQRGYRRSLDASISLPSFSVPELRRPAVESDAWLHSHQAQRSRYVRNPAASNNSSPGPQRQRQHLGSDSDGGSYPTVPRHGVMHGTLLHP